MAVITGFFLAIFTVFSTTESFIEATIKYPMAMLIIAILLSVWLILVFFSSIVLVVSEKYREKAFLLSTQTEVRDELEEKAVSDAIKRTFIFNIAFLALIFSLSGLFYQVSSDAEGEGSKVVSLGYSFAPDDFENIDHDKVASMLDKLPEKYSEKAEKYKESLKIADAKSTTTHHIISRRFFSPFGVLCYLLLQLVFFRVFLYLNRRELA
jgi:hypothetical protein